jgi:uncharacterized membrane protein YkvA (DUF1232 family)
VGNLERWKERARQLKAQTYALYLAYRDPRTPWYARLLAAAVVAYAVSPIDLIPDPIPILGYLDDLILVPLGITLALRWIPAEVMAECRARAEGAMEEGLGPNWLAGGVVVLLWVALAALAVVWLVGLWR